MDHSSQRMKRPRERTLSTSLLMKLTAIAAFQFLTVLQHGVAAFQVTLQLPHEATSTTVLFGFRKSVKATILRPFKSRRPNNIQTKKAGTALSALAEMRNTSLVLDTESAQFAVNEDESDLVETVVADGALDDLCEIVARELPIHVESREQAPQERHRHSSVELAQVPIVNPALQNQSTSSHSLYNLPPVERKLTRLEEEFRGMLAEFTAYSAADILSLRDQRTRVLFEGIVASAGEPLVYRAFEVLFEDLVPLRLGGRLIYRKLKRTMAESIVEQDEEVAAVVASTELPAKDVRAARLAFLGVAMPLNGKPRLSLSQLATTGLASFAVLELGFESAEKFFQQLDTSGKGYLTFVDLLRGLTGCAEEVCSIQNCNAAETVRRVVDDLVDHAPKPEELTPKKQRLSNRYDQMVESFRAWEGFVPDQAEAGNLGRRQMRVMEVIWGCFKGADNPYVVNALKVLYVDYNALRVAGDIIFGIVSTIMNKRMRRQAKGASSED